MASLIILIPAAYGFVTGLVSGTIAGVLSLDTLSWYLFKFGGLSLVAWMGIGWLYGRLRSEKKDYFGIVLVVAGVSITCMAFGAGYAGTYGAIKVAGHLYTQWYNSLIQKAWCA